MAYSRSPNGSLNDFESIGEWFNRIEGCNYDDSQHVLVNFYRAMEHLKIDVGSQECQVYLDSLAGLISRCTLAYPRTTGISEYLRGYFNENYPDIPFDPDNTAKANLERVKRATSGLPSDEFMELRDHLVREIKADQAYRYKQYLEEKRAEKTGDAIKQRVQKRLASESSLIPMAEVERLVEEGTAKFFRKQRAHEYNKELSAVDNFFQLTISDSKNRYRERLNDFLQTAMRNMKPEPIDRKFAKDYAKKFWSRYRDFERVPGRTSREEFDKLAVQQKWNNSKGLIPAKLDSLKDILRASIISDIIVHLDESPQLSVLTPAGRSASKQTKVGSPPIEVPVTHAVKDHTAAQTKSAKQQPPTEPQIEEAGSIQKRFLNRFPHFTPDSTESLTASFDRLAIQQNWRHGSRTYTRQRAEYLRDQFEDEWSEIAYTPDDSDDEGGEGGGVDISKASKLAQWQNLCNELGIDPAPKSIRQCRKALQSVYVNIIDLLDARRVNNVQGDGTVAVRKFETASALAKYTRNEQKIFPKAQAKKQGAIRALLIHVFGGPAAKKRGL